MAGAEQIAQLAVQLVLQDEDFKKKLLSAQGQTKSAGANFEKMGKSLDKFVTRAFQASAVAMVGFVAASAKVGASFEYEMRKVGAITMDGMENIDALTSKARELGAATSFTATEAAGAMVNFARAGFTSNQILQATTPALLLAESSAASMDLATASLAATMKQFSMDTLQSARAADTLSMTTRISMFDLQGLTDAMKYGGSVGAAFGMTLEETAAALAQFRNLGLEASMAGMNFRMSMAQAAKATPKAKKALQELGLTAADINPQLHSFGDIIKNVGDASLTTAQAMTIFGRRAGANIAVLARQMSAGLSTYESDLAKIRGAQGSVMELWEQMTDTVQYQGTVSKSAFQELMLGVFDSYSAALKEMFRELTNTLNFVSDVFAMSDSSATGFSSTIEGLTRYLKDNREAIAIGFIRLLDAMNQLFDMTIAWAPRLGFVAKMLGSMFVAVKIYAFIMALQKAIITFKLLQVAVATTTVSMRVLAVSMGPIVLAIMAAGAAFAYLSMNTDDAAESADNLLIAKKRLAKWEGKLSKARGNHAKELLLHTKSQITAQKDISTATGEFSDALKQENDALMTLTEGQAVDLIQKGQLVNIDGELFSVRSAMLDLGIEGANDKIADSIVELQKVEAQHLTDIKNLGEANQGLRKEKQELIGDTDGYQASVKALSGQMQYNQIRMKALKNEANRVGSQYTNLAQTLARTRDEFIRLDAAKALIDDDGGGGGGGESRSSKRRKAEADITAFHAEKATEREFRDDQELLSFVQNLQKQSTEIDKLYDKRIKVAKNRKDRKGVEFQKDMERSRALSMVERDLLAEKKDLLNDSIMDASELEKMSKEEFETFQIERSHAVRDHYNKVDALAKHSVKIGVLSEKHGVNAAEQSMDMRIDQLKKLGQMRINNEQRWNMAQTQQAREELQLQWQDLNAYEERKKSLREKELAWQGILAEKMWAGKTAMWGKDWVMSKLFASRRKGLERDFVTGQSVDLREMSTLQKQHEAEVFRIRSTAGDNAGAMLLMADKKFARQQMAVGLNAATEAGQIETSGLFKRVKKITAVEKAKNDTLEGMTAATEAEKAAVAEKFDEQIKNLRKEGWADFAKAAKAAFDVVKRASMATFGAMKQGLEAVAKVFNTVTGGFGEMGLDSMLDTAATKAEETDEEGNLINQDRSTGELVAEAMNEAFDKMIERIGSIIEALPAMITTFIQRLPELITAFVEGLPEIVAALTDNLGPLIDTIVEAIPQVVNAVTAMFGEIVNAFAEHFPALVSALVDALGPLIEAVVAALPIIVGALMEALPDVITLIANVLTQIIEGLPDIIDVIINLLPAIIEAVLTGLDDIILAIFNVIPVIIEKVVMALPDLILALIQGVLLIITTLVEEIPRLIAMIINQIPMLILKLIQSVTVIMMAVVESIPMIIMGLVEALPELIGALISLIPAVLLALIVGVVEHIPAIIMMLIDEFVLGLPALVIKIVTSLVKGIIKAAGQFAKVFTDIFKEAFSVIKNPFKKDKQGRNWFQRTGSNIKKSWNNLWSYSGIDYVPATMRMTVHKGEAVIPANRNMEMGNAGMGRGDPGFAGAPGGGGGGGGGFNVPPIDISVIAEGRVLDKIQVSALRRGHAPEMQELLRRASGVKVGFNRGKFNRFG